MKKTTKQETKYKIEDAIVLLKKESKAKFDATVELHINLDLDKKQEQAIRFTTQLPHGTGKTKKVAVMTVDKVPSADLEIKESDLPKIEKGEIKPGRDFDIMVAHPSQMPKLAKVARVLGPAGVMPNPKNGTVTEDVEKAVQQIKKGKVEVRTEANAEIIHTVLGKVSFEDKALLENYQEIMTSIRHNKPQKAKPEFITSAFISPTMGKSYQLEI